MVGRIVWGCRAVSSGSFDVRMVLKLRRGPAPGFSGDGHARDEEMKKWACGRLIRQFPNLPFGQNTGRAALSKELEISIWYKGALSILQR